MQTIIKNKLFLSVAAVAIVAAVGIAGFMLQPSDLEKYFVSGNGRIEATEVDVATKLGGRIIDIFVNEGDFVKRGQVLAQMQNDTLKAQYDEAAAQYQQAVNAVKSITAQVSVRKSDLATATAVVAQRVSEYDAAKKRFVRSNVLVNGGAVSRQVLDDDKANMNSMSAAVNAAKAQEAAAKATILATQAQLVSAQSTVEAVAATMKRIEVDIADCRLTAPRDGRVQYRIAQPGEVLGAGGKVLNIVDLSDIYMTFFLPEPVVGQVAFGGDVHLVLDAMPNDPILAHVSFVASTAQFTPKTVETASERQKLMFRVKARINKDYLIRNLAHVKTGLPGVAWIKLNSQVEWPAHLVVRTIK